MFLVLRKRSIKRTLALAILLIMVGISLVRPHSAQAESNLLYLYPYPGNNPVQPSGLFWAEEAPTWGAFSLATWSEFIPGRQIVVGVPEDYQVNSAMLGNNLGKYITTKLGGKVKGNTGGGRSTAKDSLTYEREIYPDGIKEKVRVEINEHFRNNDNFEKYMDILKNHLTNPDELPTEKPAPKAPDNDTAQAAMLGNTLILGGLALMARVAYTVVTKMPPPF